MQSFISLNVTDVARVLQEPGASLFPAACKGDHRVLSLLVLQVRPHSVLTRVHYNDDNIILIYTGILLLKSLLVGEGLMSALFSPLAGGSSCITPLNALCGKNVFGTWQFTDSHARMSSSRFPV